jgi:hypothetical protein
MSSPEEELSSLELDSSEEELLPLLELDLAEEELDSSEEELSSSLELDSNSEEELSSSSSLELDSTKDDELLGVSMASSSLKTTFFELELPVSMYVLLEDFFLSFSQPISTHSLFSQR